MVYRPIRMPGTLRTPVAWGQQGKQRICRMLLAIPIQLSKARLIGHSEFGDKAAMHAEEPPHPSISNSRFAEFAGRLASKAAARSADTLTLKESLHETVPSEVIARFTQEMQGWIEAINGRAKASRNQTGESPKNKGLFAVDSNSEYLTFDCAPPRGVGAAS
jgi:hypothetical protein